MICVRLNGGLGNQMFQYACGQALATKHQTGLLLDISALKFHDSKTTARNFDLNIFPLVAKVGNSTEVAGSKTFFYRIINTASLKLGMGGIRTSRFFVEKGFAYNKNINKCGPQCYLVGYWQSPRYFKQINAEILRTYTFPDLSGNNAETYQHIQLVNSVSFHIRRGDFFNKSAHNIHGTCSLDYYKKAIKYIEGAVISPVFFIFSDDVNWAKTHLDIKQAHYFVTNNTGENSYIDMQLMSLCQHNIIANSSFSWWGAWLNQNPDKIVIAPEVWFANETMNNATFDLIPEQWIRM